MKKLIDLKNYNLTNKQKHFVIEYIKDFNPRRAAESTGYEPDYGYKLILSSKISDVIEQIIQGRLEDAMIDAEWLLYEIVDNHHIARQQGNITASNSALNLLAKHKGVDAFAADKINVSTDADIANRLIAARERLRASESDQEVSFL